MNSPTWTEILSSVSGTVAVAVGGVWAGWRVFVTRPFAPRAALNLSVSIEPPFDRPQVVVRAIVRNVGGRRFSITSDEVDVYTSDAVTVLLGPVGQLESAKAGGVSLFQGDLGQKIESGEERSDTAIFTGEDGVKSATVYATLGLSIGGSVKRVLRGSAHSSTDGVMHDDAT
ncbi:MAG: hypothetical protein AAGD33_06040 [Actinomycetota bacterium]